VEEYRERMKRIARQARQSVILGHQLEVNLSDDDRWGVAVDGLELLTRHVEAYDAWAVGVAESYRRGIVESSPRGHD
jgi:hypothetical protein